MQSTWIALIPVYQPSESLLQLLEEAKSKGFHIIVVNDGSSQTAKDIFRRAAEYGTVLNHSQNLGKGRAIKTGLYYIQTHYSCDRCIVVTMDADGQHKVSDAETLCRAVQSHPEALILGSRKLQKNIPLRSMFGNSVTRLVYCISTGQKIRDTQTGLRAFGSQMIPQLLCIPGDRYEYEMNVLLTFSRNKIPIIEQEIDTIYIDGNSSSHFNAVKDSYRIYKEIFKFSAASLISFFVDYGFYSLFTLLTSGYSSTLSVVVSNIGARIISASTNYSINRILVFQSKVTIGKSAIQYAMLAGVILLGNTVVLSVLTNHLGVNRYIAKLVTEIAFFFVSWLIQRNFIFRKDKE